MVKTFTAYSDGRFEISGRTTRCALGKNGVLPAKDKREGDNASPLGIWPLRSLFYRPDRISAPKTPFPRKALSPQDGWCDAVDDENYNRLVRHPYPNSAEKLWRDDGVYDLIWVLGHNDDPVVAGMGSAIFLHLARPDFSGTEGCIALSLKDLLDLTHLAEPGDVLEIREA